MAFVYNISPTSYEDPGGPPPGSPPTCTLFQICLSPVGLISVFSKVPGPMAVNSDIDFIIYRHGRPSYLLILSNSMASPLRTKN